MHENLPARPRAARPFAGTSSWVAAAIALLVTGSAAVASVEATRRFAAEMAAQGNWREARFRWEQVRLQQPENPSLLNNLAVANEALGAIDEALVLYRRAADLAPSDARIADNRERFERFRQQTLPRRDPSPSETESPIEPATQPETRISKRGKTQRVPIRVTLPPRLDLTGMRTILVASFLAEDSALLDTNRELVRFLRAELRKHTSLEVLEITPPPAVPEQTLEDLIANHEFWQRLGRLYEADLVLSGVVRYERRDASGFENVDVTSARTGHKVRRSEFVEQERFTYELDVLFFDGASGSLRFRDRLTRGATFRGQQNDPITAFFDLSASMTSDILAVVSPRVREDVRLIFRD